MMEGAVMEYIKAFLGMIVGALVIVAVIFLFRLNEINTFQQEVNYQIERNGGLTDDAKNALLEIPYQILNASGTKSEEVASWMAQGLKRQLKTDIGIGIVKNDSAQTYWIAIADDAQEELQTFPFPIKENRSVIEKVFKILAAQK